MMIGNLLFGEKEEKSSVREKEEKSSVPIGQDWKQLFKSVQSFGSLSYHEPVRQNGRVVVQPPREVVEEGILKSSSSLVCQFLDHPVPFFVVKWIICGQLMGKWGCFC
jgi:hypothetical protein